jgi:hypothetical protein
MRIFTSFLIVLIDVLLWLLPYTTAIYDFRTDIQTDYFTVFTPVGITTENVSFSKSLYGNDVQTISIYSDVDTETPTLTSYNGSTRLAEIGNLSANTTRTLTVDYDTPAFDASGAIAAFMDKIPWFWMTLLSIFPLAALIYIWWGKLTGRE